MIILSIPFKDNFTFDFVRSYRHDLLELRVDYSVNRITDAEKLSHDLAKVLSQSTSKSLITLRSSEEGGHYSGSPEQKRYLFESLVKENACLVDCELQFYLDNELDFNPENLIISKHFTSYSYDDLRKSVSETIAAAKEIKASYYKFVFPVENYSDLEFFLELNREHQKKTIFQGTGSLGKLFRILRLLKGFIGHYIAINDYRTAPEQLSYEEFAFLSRLRFDKKTLIGGIIGTTAVYDSLGIGYYNRLFIENNLNAVYLPFPVIDEDDFFEWLEMTDKRYRLFGFSVTMPHKLRLGTRFGKGLEPINTISVLTGEKNGDHSLPYGRPEYLSNTDKDAVKRSLAHLNIDKDDTVLIFGYGGTAATFLSVTDDYRSVFITGRNEVKGSILAERFNRRFLKLSEIENTTFDLIVNCTPLGSNRENFPLLDKNVIFKKAIDLPYYTEPTTLIRYCIEKSIPFIDGKTFWQWQSEEQKSIFIANIKAGMF